MYRSLIFNIISGSNFSTSEYPLPSDSYTPMRQNLGLIFAILDESIKDGPPCKNPTLREGTVSTIVDASKII
jgi:hypothetical protein